MQPLFTIHAGEYLVGSHIEQHLRDPNGDKVNVWVPSKDTGIDLLVADKTNKKDHVAAGKVLQGLPPDSRQAQIPRQAAFLWLVDA